MGPPTPANPDPLWDAFLKGLREIGYIDGKNIKIEHRYAEGMSDRLDALIAEFLQLKVDVIVVPGSPLPEWFDASGLRGWRKGSISLRSPSDRTRHRERVRLLREQAELDRDYLGKLLARHNLEGRWKP